MSRNKSQPAHQRQRGVGDDVPRPQSPEALRAPARAPSFVAITCGVNLECVTSSRGAVVLVEETTKTIAALPWTGC